MKAVIMAGGKGTRLLEVTNDLIPKPMALVGKKPILEHQIEELKRNGISEICIVVGYLGDKIQEHFGDGSNFQVKISYYVEEKPLGTAGALPYLLDFVSDSPFFLVFGDVIFDIDLHRMERFHQEKQGVATLFVHPNSHPFDSDLVVFDENFQINGFISKNGDRPKWYANYVNAGFYILEPSLIESIPKDSKTDLEKDLLFPWALQQGTVFAYTSSEYIKDVGTIERIKQAEKDLRTGVVQAKNLSNPQKCIFLDRDGVLNDYVGFLKHPDQMSLTKNSAEGVKKINLSQYLAIVVTNQPVVARGETSLETLEIIHNKLETLLGEKGAYLDAIYFCPHHPDKGYVGENPEYKIECSCRKPKIGMLQQACQDFNIDLSKSWIIGDSSRDIATGKNAGISTALVLGGETSIPEANSIDADLICSDILEAIQTIIN